MAARLLALLLLCAIITFNIGETAVSPDEAQMLWTVRDVERVQESPFTETLRDLARNARSTVGRTVETGQGILYPLLLDVWSLIAGTSAFAARALSLFWGLIGAALLYVLLRPRSHDVKFAALALTAVFIVYTARQVGAYTQLFALALLAHHGFRRWQARPTAARSLFYVAALVLTFYTHVAGLLIVLVHGLLALRRIVRWVPTAGIAVLFYVPWLLYAGDPLLFQPLVLPWLLSVVMLIVPLLAIFTLRLLARLPQLAGIIAIVVGALLAVTPLTADQTDWRAARAAFDDAYEPLQTGLIGFAPDSPAAYYDTQAPFFRGTAVNFGWRNFTADEMTAILDRVALSSRPVWLAAPYERMETWDALLRLAADRRVDYRSRVDDVLFYRFDLEGGDPLRFQFGDVLQFEGEFGMALTDRCPPVALTALQPLPEGYRITLRGIDRTDRFYFVESALPALGTGETYTPDLCLLENAGGVLYLELSVRTPEGRALPVLESDVLWGDGLTFGITALTARSPD